MWLRSLLLGLVFATGCTSLDERLEGLSDPDPEDRQEAVVDLGHDLVRGRIDDPAEVERVNERLIAALEDESALVRVTAAGYLGRTRVSAAGPTVIKLLADPVMLVRLEAARVLGELGESAAREPLEGLYRRDGNYHVRRTAIVALGKLRQEPTLVLFVEALEDVELGVRQAAQTALATQAGRDLGSRRDPWQQWLRERERR